MRIDDIVVDSILKNNEKQTNLIQDSTASEIEFLEF